MTKQQLQKELLEKVKEGVKPSDLKKKKLIKPKSLENDEGYSSEEEKIPTPPITPNQKIKDLQKQVNFWTNTAQNHLKSLQLAQAKVSNLEEQIRDLKSKKTPKPETELLKEKNKQIEIIAKENEKNEKKVKELEAKITEQENNIEELKKQVKIKENDKQEQFTCYHCKKEQKISLLVLELPEGKLCQPCWAILRKKTKEAVKTTPKPNQPFICVACEVEKQETPIYKKVEISYKKNLIKGKEYPICSSCLPHIKEYNEKEKDSDRDLEEWE